MKAVLKQMKQGIQHVRLHVDIGLHACHMTDHEHTVQALGLITNGAKTFNVRGTYGEKRR
ncbi:hypothetical protein [Virgibacillus halodenitrificans]|uniref:Amidohydrolase family protein n=1 Tax=Virgibacillus halodenitrificans TaxID=1482 RepID=A0ABR7VGU9_VIRHA|nr:hypothetical protein [Virgibacillus halodenitrificans]MBD1221175.1 hypothetical protein [Virgibacillus halodenitrificans]